MKGIHRKIGFYTVFMENTISQFRHSTGRRSEGSTLKPSVKPYHLPTVMSVISSSSSSLPSNSSSSNFYDIVQKCFDTKAGTYSMTAFIVNSILLILPLCIYVIYLGFQRWRQQRSSLTMSHCDIITFHVVVVELMNIAGAITTLTCLREALTVGVFILSINITGQVLFHTLTCVERYLAVVHPVTYLGLKKGKGIRIRNLSIGCVWLLSIANIGVLFLEEKKIVGILFLCVLSFIFLVISFCSLSVLYVLIRPGPGAGGEGRQRVDQSKMRAFYTIVAILGALVLRVGGTTVQSVVDISPDVGESEKCIVFLSLSWFTLPSSLVLPLLFLHRAGKLLCCKNINTSGQASD
ncbi:uncharacterized protein [Clinocottus analis]|uniref:uncharacterized protein isoform X3 n=1 Tax=Clinocottus analis TaxID=304258 RepID=UPI0035C13CAD